LRTFADQAVIAMENARLIDQLHQRTDALGRSVEELEATGDVLKTISRSSTDLKGVLDTLLETVARLCRADQAYMFRRHEELHHLIAAHGVPPEGEEYIRTHPFKPERGTASGRVAMEKRAIHIEDVLNDPEYTYSEGQKAAGFRTMLGLPLLREDTLIGVFVLSRTHCEGFSQQEIDLARSFADQAAIAIENARLFEELRDRQAELRVTFDNMGDGVVMFDANLKLAAWNRNFQQLLDVPDDFLASRPGLEDYVRMLVERGELGDRRADEEVERYRQRATRKWSTERVRPDGRVLEVRNNPVPSGGAVLIYSDITKRKQAEAEIRKARDVAEAALERQTATAGILKVIASSPADTHPAFDAIAQSANRLLGGLSTTVWRLDGEQYHLVSFTPTSPEADAALRAMTPLSKDHGDSIAPAAGSSTTEIADTETGPPFMRKIARLRGFRACLAASLRIQGESIGFVNVTRREPGGFGADDIQLLKTFADQAVIAIQNAKLFTELREALEQQTATAEVLRVISQSPTDVEPVLAAVASAARRFCGADDAMIVLRKGQEQLMSTHDGSMPALVGTSIPLDRSSTTGRACLEGRTVHVPDVGALDSAEHEMTIELARRTNVRALLAAPMLRDGIAIGSILLRKPEPIPFTPRQVALLETFAAQAVIAIENVRLFTELRDSLERLKAAQANLIQSEKMASLGQLTAGIAHEIKNPLNFVNNFASLSSELVEELRQGVDALLREPDREKRAELQESMDLLTGNLAKIVEHGRRADGIVKSMLAHSRGGTGDWQQSNVNALVEEALNLAYHGARAQDKDFNVTLERDLAPEMKAIEVVPQDITRVFLNLFGNGFYAASKRQARRDESGYRPMLKVSTRDLGETIEIRVRDNGTGIAPEVQEKLFQPFFTTKPTGEGTGLGLSISYDIVTQQHSGVITVDSEPGAFTEFVIQLPRRRGASRGGEA
jgi:PAS domain S-box-containing protein